MGDINNMTPWYRKSVSTIVEEINTDLQKGLNTEEINERLNIYGQNRLKEKKGRSPLQMFFDQFKNVLVIILLISAVVSAFLGETGDAVIITIILILNSTMGVIQEYKAEKSLAALKEMTAPDALVLRDGKQQQIMASELVPGDIVLLEAGDYVPADLRLFSSIDLKTEESVLTGESFPVEKTIDIINQDKAPLGDQKNLAFMGTAVTYGNGRGIVIATGMETEMGQIAEMLGKEDREPTPLQQRLDRMGKKLGLLTLFIVIIVIIAGLFRGMGFLDMFMTGISLAVAAVPEGLPAVVTIVLALGVQRMINKHAIIRHLPAVETLGATTIICTDKTGTLTQNQMTVKSIYLPGKNIEVGGEGYKPEGEFFLASTDKKINPEKEDDLSLLLKAATLCNNAELYFNDEKNNWNIIGDPTEGALIVTAAKAGLQKAQLEINYSRIKEFPFDSSRKLMSTINLTPEQKKLVLAKGAPDEILKICTLYRYKGENKPLDEEMRKEVLSQNEAYASNALRVLAVACKDFEDKEEYQLEKVENNLTFIGLMAMIDPPRQEVNSSVQTCKQAGIKPIMITGDYPVTARTIATELGIYNQGDRIITGSELEEMPQDELEKAVLETTVFARVSPRHKSRIVNAFKQNKQIVAMTGDGVNDAPALKESNIGVAMGITGTDVSREAADMVLTDDNFASIVAAVGEGRAIYQNIKKFIRFLLSCNIGEILALFIAIIIGLPRPLIPIQILWVNLVTDGLPALALGVDPAAHDLMQRPPRDPDEGIFAGKTGFNIISQGLYIGFITLISFVIGLSYYSLPVAQTMAFGTLSLSQLWHSFNSRSERYSIFKIGFFSNKYLLLAITISGVLQLVVMILPSLQQLFKVTPLSGVQWLILILISASPICFVELLKKLGLTY
jgi:P-type Ca2+ transporter type 2C